MAFDFNQDIAPLRQQYFPMLTGSAAFDRNMQYQAETLDPLRQRLAAAQNNAIQLRSNELAYQRQKLALRQQRDEMRQQQELLEVQPMIEKKLEEIRLSDAPPQEKRAAFTEVAMDNVGYISKSPILSSLFQFQDKLLTSRMREDSERQSERNSFANTYANRTINTPAFNEDIYRGLKAGEVSMQEASDYVNQFSQQEREREAQQKQLEGMREATTGQRKEMADDLEGYLKSLESFKLEEGYNTPESEDEEPVMVQKLSPADRDDAIRALLRARGMPLTDENFALVEDEYQDQDQDLRREAIRAVERRLTNVVYGRNKPFLTEQGEANQKQIFENAGLTAD